MPLPPDWLVEWTQYGLLLAGTISAYVALIRGTTLVNLKITDLRGLNR